MTIFQTTSNYVSELSVSYDAVKERFLGEFTSRGGVYRIEAVNMADLSQEMEGLLREEYFYMQQEIARSRSRQRSSGRGRGGGGGSSEAGTRVHVIDKSQNITARQIDKKSYGVGKWVELISGGSSLATGRYVDAGFTAFSLLIGDMYEGVESLWDKSPKEKIFAASFGGILITAGSRHQLRKKIWRQKNRRIHHIMMNVRKAGLIKDDPHGAPDLQKENGHNKKRIQNKKKRAQILRPKSWEMRVSPQGQETGWRSKSLNLRSRVKDKKLRSKSLWEHQKI